MTEAAAYESMKRVHEQTVAYYDDEIEKQMQKLEELKARRAEVKAEWEIINKS